MAFEVFLNKGKEFGSVYLVNGLFFFGKQFAQNVEKALPKIFIIRSITEGIVK